jgi:hypothetical protein
MAKEKDNQFSGGLEGDLDSRLLKPKIDDKESSSDRVGTLREAKRSSKDLGNGYQKEAQDLRQAVLQKKQQAKITAAKEAKTKIFRKIGSMRKGTSALLRGAWINLIDSFGLTLIWIDIHVFLGKVVGHDSFCKLGEEWTDKVMAGLGSSTSKEVLERKARNSVGLVEKIGLGCLNLGCLIVVIVIFVIIALVLKFIESPLEFFAGMIGYVWNSAKDAIVRFSSGS